MLVVCELTSLYHRVTGSFWPYNYFWIRANNGVVQREFDKLSKLVCCVYRNISQKSPNVVSLTFVDVVKGLALILSEGVLLCGGSIVMFPRNYLWISMLGKQKRTRESRVVRTKLLRVIRQSFDWIDFPNGVW